MEIKNFDRVGYTKNILFEVVCQMHFSSILKISTQPPDVFQDRIRKEYPYYEKRGGSSSLPKEMPPEVRNIIASTMRQPSSHHFISEDKKWEVSLASDFIALVCKGYYTTFEAFQTRLQNILEIFYEVYEPSYISKIGLRYQNAASKTVLELDELNVNELIPKEVAPELYDASIKDAINEFEKRTKIVDENNTAIVIHALGNVTAVFSGRELKNERAYIIDIDCQTEERFNDPREAVGRVVQLKEYEWNIFNRSITDKLRELMQPIK